MAWDSMQKKHSQRKCALYMRVSKFEQNVDAQRIELREWAERSGLEVVAEIDDTITGKADARPGLDELRKLVRAGRVNVVACWKLDRVGRTLRDFVMLMEEFDAYGCAMVATSQGIDTRANTAAGRLQMAVLLAVAEFEHSLISERTRAGLEAARRRGAKIGKQPNKQVPPNASEVIAEWEAEGGKGYRDLARRLGVDSLGTVHALVKTLRAKRTGQAVAT